MKVFTGLGQVVKSDSIPENLIYDVLNQAVKDKHIKRLYRIPNTSYYYSRSGDSAMTGIESYLWQIEHSDSSMYFIKKSDYAFFKTQIIHPAISRFKKSKVVNSKVKRHSRPIIFFTNSVSLPIFTKDLKSAVITCYDWGRVHNYLYHWNSKTKVWDRVWLWSAGA